jgi:hypothetical protein
MKKKIQNKQAKFTEKRHENCFLLALEKYFKKIQFVLVIDNSFLLNADILLIIFKELNTYNFF